MTLGVGSDLVGRLAPRERVELILSQLDQLPTLPAVGARLLTVTTSEESSARDVVHLVESDASLTAAILRMARRADLGLPAASMTVGWAVTALGFAAVRNAVLSLQVFETLSSAGQGDRAADTRRELWKHSLAVACAAELLAGDADGASLGGEAFVCGLLHDIGKVALDVCLPKSYARVVEHTQSRHACICDVERQVLGLDHTVAGKRLVSRWQLPAPIVDVVWLHHQDPDALPSSAARADLIRIVHLADNLVRRLRIGFSGYQHIASVERLAEALGLDETALDRVGQQLPQRMEPFFELVGLEDSTGRTLYAESLAKANKELGRLNTQLAESNRRLEIRSACFEALGQFAKRLSPKDRVGDVCAAAAQSAGVMLGVDGVVAFAASPSRRCVHTAYVGTTDREPSTSLIDLGESLPVDELCDQGTGWTVHGFMPATEVCDTIWRRVARPASQGPLWMLPFAPSDATVGALMFVAPEDIVRPFQSFPAECGALSTAVGLAIGWAVGRVEAERLNEELVDLNRKLGAARKELVQARSIGMIAEMAAGAAHELNNPLAVISGRAQMVRSQIDDPEVSRAMQIIVDQAQEATQMVTDLMAYAKPEPPHPVEQRLGDLFDGLSQRWLAGSSLADNQLTVCLADAGAGVYADPRQLDEILASLLANALQATGPETARLHINSPSRASDEKVRIVVEDNGVGMTREVLEHAFDPFFSDRPAGRGRGLGLSRATRLAEINGGRLWLDSTPNVGTTATLELPAGAPSS